MPQQRANEGRLGATFRYGHRAASNGQVGVDVAGRAVILLSFGPATTTGFE